MSEKFEGFEPANTTPVPDVLFDELLPTLKEAELKALLYIIRRTLGFKKSTDAISLTQFQKGITTKDGRVLDKGCGVKDRTTLVKALASLVTKGCIECIKTKTSKGDDDITLYRIRFREVVGNSYHLQSEGSGQFLPHVVGKPDHRSGQTRPQVVGNSYPQETVKQETVKQESENVNADAINIAPAHSSLSEKKIEQVTLPTPSAESEQTPEPQVEKKPARKRAPRKTKSKGFDVPEELVERVNKFYEFLNGWAVKKTGLQQTWFAADDESNELICALLTSRTVTQKNIEQVCNALWDEPRNTRTGYYPREHMTVKAIINAYKAKSLMFAANETKATTPAITQPYSLAGYTYKPEEAATTDLPFAGPLRLRNKKRGA